MAFHWTIVSLQVLTWQGIIGLVMEYAIGGPLSTLAAVRCGLPEVAAKWYFQQVVMAVDFCHQKVPRRCLRAVLIHIRRQVHPHICTWSCSSIAILLTPLPLQGYACRDIKLENVLLVNNAGTLVKLCIAGCSQVSF